MTKEQKRIKELETTLRQQNLTVCDMTAEIKDLYEIKDRIKKDCHNKDKTIRFIAEGYLIEFYELQAKLIRVRLRLEGLGYDVRQMQSPDGHDA